MTTAHWWILTVFCYLAVVVGVTFTPWLAFGYVGGAVLQVKAMNFQFKAMKEPHTARVIEPSTVDGRTPQEWYDLIVGMGREEFERLSRPALDGLEESADNIGGWDVRRLLGTSGRYNQLMREFYPDRVCSHCSELDCPNGCEAWLKEEARWEKRELERAQKAKALPPIKTKPSVYHKNPAMHDWKYTQPVKKVVDVLDSKIVSDPDTGEKLGLCERVKWSDGKIEWRMASEAAFKARVKADEEAERKAERLNPIRYDVKTGMVTIYQAETALSRLDAEMAMLEAHTRKWEEEARMISMRLDPVKVRQRRQKTYFLD